MSLRDEETGQLWDIHEDDLKYCAIPLEEDKSKFHAHHDVIVAWARGAEIQKLFEGYSDRQPDEWMDDANPIWNPYVKYRIKPDKPDNSETIAKLEGKHAELLNQLEEIEAELLKLRGE